MVFLGGRVFGGGARGGGGTCYGGQGLWGGVSFIGLAKKECHWAEGAALCHIWTPLASLMKARCCCCCRHPAGNIEAVVTRKDAKPHARL